MWAVAEKVGALGQNLDDPGHPHVAYHRGASQIPVPVVRGIGIRVQTLAIAVQQWGLALDQIAAEYGVPEAQVRDALEFYRNHRAEIDAAIASEQVLERQHA